MALVAQTKHSEAEEQIKNECIGGDPTRQTEEQFQHFAAVPGWDVRCGRRPHVVGQQVLR